MKIYLAGSISGGRKYEKHVQQIAEELRLMGHELLTPFVVDPQVNQARFEDLPLPERAKAIYKEDIELLSLADVFVAEVSQPSHGVGIELGILIGMAEFAKRPKPILLLRNEELKEKSNPSKMLYGNPYSTFTYYSKDTLKEFLEGFFNAIGQGGGSNAR